MSGKIFINYRRGDDPGNTGRLFDRLQETFGPDQLFMDVDSIKPGLDFVKVLEELISHCDVVLAVIGRSWIDARDETGARRLDNPGDFVRIEIESALAKGKRVIPVLVGEARMPRSDELPDPIKPLARRHAVRLTHERFRADTRGLIKVLTEALEEADALHKAQAENARQAAEDEKRRRGEQVAREHAQAQREAEERTRPQKAPAWLTTAQAAPTPQADDASRGTQQGALLRPASWRPKRRLTLIGGAFAAGIGGVVAIWIAALPASPPERPQLSPGRLTVAGPDTLMFTGPEGGPFTPDRSSLALRATGSGFHWSVEGTIPQWLNVSPSQGELAADASAAVIVALAPAARSLGHGQYNAKLGLKNQSTNETVPWIVSLAVQGPPPPPGRLAVSGPDVMTFTGPEGGPFTPGWSSLALRATGSGFHWSVEGTIPQWLTVSPIQGNVAADGAATVAVTLAPAARSVGHGHYSARLVFKNESTNETVPRTVNLAVQEASPNASGASPAAGITPPAFEWQGR